MKVSAGRIMLESWCQKTVWRSISTKSLPIWVPAIGKLPATEAMLEPPGWPGSLRDDAGPAWARPRPPSRPADRRQLGPASQSR